MGLAERELCSNPINAQADPAPDRQPFWCAVQVRPNHERAASEHLSVKQCEYFLPMYRSRRRWSDRVKELELPLFPGYLFCRYGEGRRRDILTSFGVIRILGYEGAPDRVSEEEIEAIRIATQSGLTCRPAPYLVAGAAVRIETGALKGLTGIVIREKRNQRQFIISVSLLQRSIAVELDADCLGPVDGGVCSGMARYALGAV